MRNAQHLLEANYPLYHKSYTSAITAVLDQIKKAGYTHNQDDFDQQVTFGQGRPKSGKTHRFRLDLYKGDAIQKQKAHVQIYNMENGSYELNFYIS